MRIVDADALIEDIKSFWDWDSIDGITATTVLKQTMTDISHAPTIDAVPVVRCKDCKWFDKQRCVCHNPRYGDGYANYQPPNTNDEYWCADGERKDR